jgi:hypothetical protein
VKQALQMPELPFQMPELPFQMPELPFLMPELPFQMPELGFHRTPFQMPELLFQMPELPFQMLELGFQMPELRFQMHHFICEPAFRQLIVEYNLHWTTTFEIYFSSSSHINYNLYYFSAYKDFMTDRVMLSPEKGKVVVITK